MPFTEIIANGGNNDFTPNSISSYCCVSITPDAVYCSPSITPTCYNTPAKVTVCGGCCTNYCISDGLGWRASCLQCCITPGQTLMIRSCLPSTGFSGDFITCACIGGNFSYVPATCFTFTLNGKIFDNTPDSFSICSWTDVCLSATCVWAVAVSGFDAVNICSCGPLYFCHAGSGGWSSSPSTLCCCCGSLTIAYCVQGPGSGCWSTTCNYSLVVGTCIASGSITSCAMPPMRLMNLHRLCDNTINVNCIRIFDDTDNRCRMIANCFYGFTSGIGACMYYSNYHCRWFYGFRCGCTCQVNLFASSDKCGTSWGLVSSSCSTDMPTLNTNYISGDDWTSGSSFWDSSMTNPEKILCRSGINGGPEPMGGVGVRFSTGVCGYIAQFDTTSLLSNVHYRIDYSSGTCSAVNLSDALYTSVCCKITRILSVGTTASGYVGIGIYSPRASFQCSLSNSNSAGRAIGCVFPGYTGCLGCNMLAVADCGYTYDQQGYYSQLYIIRSADGINWCKTPTSIFGTCYVFADTVYGCSLVTLGRDTSGNWFMLFSPSFAKQFSLYCHSTNFPCTSALKFYSMDQGGCTTRCSPWGCSNIIYLGSNLGSPCFCAVSNTSISWMGYTGPGTSCQMDCMHTCGPTLFRECNAFNTCVSYYQMASGATFCKFCCVCGSSFLCGQPRFYFAHDTCQLWAQQYINNAGLDYATYCRLFNPCVPFNTISEYYSYQEGSITCSCSTSTIVR